MIVVMESPNRRRQAKYKRKTSRLLVGPRMLVRLIDLSEFFNNVIIGWLGEWLIVVCKNPGFDRQVEKIVGEEVYARMVKEDRKRRRDDRGYQKSLDELYKLPNRRKPKPKNHTLTPVAIIDRVASVVEVPPASGVHTV